MRFHSGVAIDDLLQLAAKEIPSLIRAKREWTYWDFKREWHEDNVDLIHDIICLANNVDRDISYLIIGVDEENDYAVCEDEASLQPNRKSTQQLTDFLSNHIWSNGRAPFVIVRTLEIMRGYVDAVIIVSSRKNMPYCLAKNQGKLFPITIHIRRGDQNTPINGTATWAEAEDVWRHHFGLDTSPIERVQMLLEDKENWCCQSDYNSALGSYYRYAPEYTISEEPDDDRNAYEYYMLNQCNSSPMWYELTLSYFGTSIVKQQIVVLDGGWLTAPVPEQAFFHKEGTSVLDMGCRYCYYTKGTLLWTLQEYLFDEEFRKAIEPRSAPIEERIAALRRLHNQGCKTWVSIEPYPTPNIHEEDLAALLDRIGFVDRIVFRRLHYNKTASAYK